MNNRDRRVHDVLHIVGASGPGGLAGGVSSVAGVQATALNGVDVKVRSLVGWAAPLSSAPDGQGRGYIRLWRLSRRAGLYTSFTPLLPRKLRQVLPGSQVAHVHLCRDFFTSWAVLIISRSDVPVVAQTHGMVSPPTSVFQSVFDKLLFNRVLRNVDHFLCLTRRERRDLEEIGIAPTKIRGIQNGVERALVSRNERPDRASPSFLFASRLHHRKGGTSFVEAGIELLKQGYNVNFVIAGPDEGDLTQMTRLAAPYSENFEFLGPVPRDRVQHLLSETTALVLPSFEEPFPMVVLEAASQGTPTILTEQSGVSQLMRAEEGAIVVRPTVEDITRAMLLLIHEPELGPRIGRNAFELYQDHWTTRKLGEELLSIYSASLA